MPSQCEIAFGASADVEGGRETPVTAPKGGTTVPVFGIMILALISCSESKADSTSTSPSPGISRGVEDAGASSDELEGASTGQVALGILVVVFFGGIYGFVFRANTRGGRPVGL